MRPCNHAIMRVHSCSHGTHATRMAQPGMTPVHGPRRGRTETQTENRPGTDRERTASHLDFTCFGAGQGSGRHPAHPLRGAFRLRGARAEPACPKNGPKRIEGRVAPPHFKPHLFYSPEELKTRTRLGVNTDSSSERTIQLPFKYPRPVGGKTRYRNTRRYGRRTAARSGCNPARRANRRERRICRRAASRPHVARR